MAAPVTHAYHATKVSEMLKEKGINVNLKYVRIGALFPDYFYFSDSRLSVSIHNKKIDELFYNLIESGGDFDIDYYSFIVGIMCHHTMDSIIHPYVFYYTGLYDKNKKETYRFRGEHFKFEYSIDDYYAKLLNSKPLSRTRINKFYGKLDTDVEKRVNVGLTKHFEEEIKINKSISKFLLFNKLIGNDLFGIKKLIYSIVDIFTRKNKYKMRYFSQFGRRKPAMNIEKETWKNPKTGEEFNYSVLEMMEEAIEKAVLRAEELKNHYNEGKQSELVVDKICYLCGTCCEGNCEMKYFTE